VLEALIAERTLLAGIGAEVSQVTDVGGVDMYQSMAYDERNELVQTNYAVYAGENSLGVQSTQIYDSDGHLTSTLTYFNNQSEQAVYGSIDVPDGTVYLSTAGWSDTAETSTYNADGVVTSQTSWVGANNWKQIENNLQQGGTLSPNVTTIARLEVASSTTYTAFDHADNVTAYSFASAVPTVFGANYTVSYIKKDGYLQQSITGTPTVSGYVPATDTLYYNAFGQNIALSQTSASNSGAAQNVTRVFAYNTTGQILQSRGGSVSGTTFTATGGNGNSHFTYVNGQQVSDMDGAGDIGVLNTLTGFNAAAQGYVVQQGDTLASIAQTVYGNSSLGYIIGQANGLNSTSTLVVGQSISLPSVTTDSNTSTTFKPYNPGNIIGSTTPNLPSAPPPPPPPSGAGCSGLAEVVVIAVTAVVTYFTAGATSEMLYTEMGTTAAAASAGEVAVATVVGAAVGAAAGDAAGQLTGDAEGIRDGFSTSEVLQQGLMGAVSVGIGVGGQALGMGGVGGAAVEGAANYVADTEVDKVTGQAVHFSWTGLVASTIGSEAGAEANSLAGGGAWGDIADRAANDVTNREVSAGMGDSDVQSWKQVGEDIFGNALGNAAIVGINAYQAQSAQQTASFNATTKNLWNQDQAQFGEWSGGAAQGLNEMAFDQQAAALIAASPQLASADAYSTYTGVHGLPDADEGSSTPSNTWQSSNGDEYNLLSLPGYASYMETNADGTPYLFQQRTVTDLTPVTVTASPQYVTLDNAYFSNSALDQQNSIDLQLQDVLPGSQRWTELKQQQAATGLKSSDPVVVANANMAAMQLHMAQVQQEMQYNGGRPMPTVEDATPSLLAHQVQQRQLNAAFAPLVASVLLTGVAAGAVEPMPMEAPPMDRLEPVSLQQNSVQVSDVVPSTTAVDATPEVGAGNNGIPPKLYHYTNEAGMQGILDSETLNPSLKSINPNDVRYGNGQYLSDIAPGTMSPAQLSRAFINNPFQGARYTNFIEIDTTGLNVIQGRPGVYVVPNEVPLDLSGRITNSGQVLGQ